MAKTKEPKNEEGLLVAAAKTIGKAAGKVAAATGVGQPATTEKKKGKLQPKNKSRLPRRQKKALQKRQSAA